MKRKEIQNLVGSIDETYINEAEGFITQSKAKRISFSTGLKRFSAIAACLVFVAAGLITFGGERIDLPSASGRVSARYVHPPLRSVKSMFDLVSLTEEELLTKRNTVIFYGTVENIQNIAINYNGEKDYRALADISVEKIYRGELKQGETITVLLPCSIGAGGWVEDTGVVSHFKKGVKGIFMPTVYDKTSISGCNGTSVCLKDLADYGFSDGERYAFLETNDGLLFSSWAYKSIENATTIDEIEDYILSMIK